MFDPHWRKFLSRLASLLSCIADRPVDVAYAVGAMIIIASSDLGSHRIL